jgi:hypothetical protein
VRAACLGLVAVLGCGEGRPVFTATIDGQPWTAGNVVATGGPGEVTVLGEAPSGGSMLLALGPVPGPGTYAMGVGPGVFGGSALVLGDGRWATPRDGRAGEVAISRLDAGRVVATFQFAVVDDKSPAGRHTIANGRLDLPLQSPFLPLPENRGARVGAVIGGQPFNAATVETTARDFDGPGIRVTARSSLAELSLHLAGVTAPGTYALDGRDPVRSIVVNNGDDPRWCCWGGLPTGDAGTITITAVTPRLRGTFSATLQPQRGVPAQEPLTIADGSFDVGIP